MEETEINSTKVYHFQMTAPVTSTWDVVQSPTNRLTLPASKWVRESDSLRVPLTYFPRGVS
ncbi:hypothetical protein [Amycolatopsis sp. NPDC003676]